MTVLEIVIIKGITTIIGMVTILGMVTVLGAVTVPYPRDDEYSNYDWSCRSHPLKFKEYYLMFMSEIWDRQTDRQTDTTVCRVAP